MTPDLAALMATVDDEWPNAPRFTRDELTAWQQTAAKFADEWPTAIARCRIERRQDPDTNRRRMRPDLAEVEAMCRAVRGRYRRVDQPTDTRQPVDPKMLVAQIEATRQALGLRPRKELA